MSGNNWSVASYSAGEFSAQGQFAPADPTPSYSSPSFSQGQFSSVSGSEYSSPSFSGGTFSSVSEPTPQHHEVHHQHHQSHQEHHQSHQVHTQSHTQVHHESSRSVSTHDAFKPLDDDLDKIIAIATGLKGQVGGARGVINAELESREVQVKKVHGDLESLQQKLDSTSFANKEERSRLEQQISVKEAEQKAKLQEYDLKVQAELDARERAERERESARGDAAAEKARVGNLLKDLEEDASGYNRLRPSRPMLTEEDTVILRQLFLSSAVSGSGKFSFADLKQILAKYGNAIPEGPLKKLFAMVENDTKGRLSYITLVAVSNDLAALVGDFRKIDTNNNGTLSRKEFREHFIRLGFDKKSVQDSLFRYADEDESDDVGFSEYIHLSLCLLVLRILYAFADFDKSGHLSKEEVKRVLDDAQIPESARKKFEHQFSVVDVDDSKSLSYQEFVMLVLLMFHED